MTLEAYFVLITMYITDAFASIFATIKIKLATMRVFTCFKVRNDASNILLLHIIELSIK